MPLSGKEMLKLFLQAGWILTHVKGSHHQMEKTGNAKRFRFTGTMTWPKAWNASS